MNLVQKRMGMMRLPWSLWMWESYYSLRDFFVSERLLMKRAKGNKYMIQDAPLEAKFVA